jgi:hypothetical protein
MIKNKTIFYIAIIILALLFSTGCQKSYDINIEKSITEGGETKGDGIYDEDSEVVLEASDNDGYRFTGWFKGTQKLSSDNSYTFNAEENINITAEFKKQFKVKTKIHPEKSGSVSGAGTYINGEVITLLAEPVEYFNFSAWEEKGEIVSTEKEYTFKLDRDMDLKAIFDTDEIFFDTYQFEYEPYSNQELKPTISPNGKYIAGLIDSNLHIYNLSDKKLIKSYELSSNEKFENIYFKPDDNDFIALISDNDKSYLRLFDIDGQASNIFEKENLELIDWTNNGKSFVVKYFIHNHENEEESDVKFYHMNLKGEIQNEITIEDKFFGVVYGKSSPYSNKIAIYVYGELVIWDLENNLLERIDFTRGFPLNWIDDERILLHIGIRTGYDLPYAVGHLSLADKKLHTIDEYNGDSILPSYYIRSISEDNKYILGYVDIDEISRPLSLNIEEEKRTYIEDLEGFIIRDSIAHNKDFYFIANSPRSDNGDKNSVLYKLTSNLELLEIKNFDEDAKIELLKVVDGTLHYLEDYTNKMHWKTISISN